VDRYTSGAAVQDEAPAVAWFASRAAAFAEAPEPAMAEALSADGPWGRAVGVEGLAADSASRLAAI
jgi:hypothetical protein